MFHNNMEHSSRNKHRAKSERKDVSGVVFFYNLFSLQKEKSLFILNYFVILPNTFDCIW